MMNEAIQRVVESQVLKAAQEVESQLDAKISAYDNLDDGDIERMRERRLEELKRCAPKGKGGGRNRRGRRWRPGDRASQAARGCARGQEKRGRCAWVTDHLRRPETFTWAGATGRECRRTCG